MADFTGKVGLIVGVANHRSLAWAIAQATSKGGANLILTYQGRFEEHVGELADTLTPRPLVLPLDVTSDERLPRSIRKSRRRRRARLRRARGRVCVTRRDHRPVREYLARGIQAGARHQRLLDDRACEGRAAADGGARRRQRADADVPWQRSRVSELQRDGRGKAALESSVRYLAADLGPENIRVNAISAGPVKTLAAAGIGGFSTILGVVREKAPLRRAIETSEVGDAAAFLLSDAGRGVTGEVMMVDAGFHILGM